METGSKKIPKRTYKRKWGSPPASIPEDDNKRKKPEHEKRPSDKLLVISVENILAEIIHKDIMEEEYGHECLEASDYIVFLHPHALEFLNKCMSSFQVVLWSEKPRKVNEVTVESIVNDEKKSDEIDSYSLGDCTAVKETRHGKTQSACYKDLNKVWNISEVFGPKNSVLVDCSPVSVAYNPQGNVIRPVPFERKVEESEKFLMGSLWVYLKRLLSVEDVRDFVKACPLGGPVDLGLVEPSKASGNSSLQSHVMNTSGSHKDAGGDAVAVGYEKQGLEKVDAALDGGLRKKGKRSRQMELEEELKFKGKYSREVPQEETDLVKSKAMALDQSRPAHVGEVQEKNSVEPSTQIKLIGAFEKLNEDQKDREREKEDLLKKVEEGENELNLLKSKHLHEMEEKDNVICSLQETVKRVEEEKERFKKESANLKQYKESLDKVLAERDNTLSALVLEHKKEKDDALNALVLEHKKELEQKNEFISSLKETLEYKNEIVSSLKETLQQKNDLVCSLQNILKTVEDAFSKLSHEKRIVEKQKDELVASLVQKDRLLDDLKLEKKKELQEKDNLIFSLNGDLKKLQFHLEDSEQKHDKEISAIVKATVEKEMAGLGSSLKEPLKTEAVDAKKKCSMELPVVLMEASELDSLKRALGVKEREDVSGGESKLMEGLRNKSQKPEWEQGLRRSRRGRGRGSTRVDSSIKSREEESVVAQGSAEDQANLSSSMHKTVEGSLYQNKNGCDSSEAFEDGMKSSKGYCSYTRSSHQLREKVSGCDKGKPKLASKNVSENNEVGNRHGNAINQMHDTKHCNLSESKCPHEGNQKVIEVTLAPSDCKEDGRLELGIERLLSSDDKSLFCPLCMEPWTTSGEHHVCSLSCGHLFGKCCIRNWLQQCRKNSRKCPTCKKTAKLTDIRELYVTEIAVAGEDIHQLLNLAGVKITEQIT